MATPTIPPPPPKPPGLTTALDVKAASGPPPAPKMEQAAMDIQEHNNPAESALSASWTERMERERGPQVPFTALQRRLAVPPIEGFYLHWFLDENIPKAKQAWFDFVDPKEVRTVDRSIGGRTAGTNGEDLGGARVSQIGGKDENGQAVQLTLMKIPLEFFFRGQRILAERNLAMVQQVFHKKAPVMSPAENQTDYNQRYTREAVIDMSNGRFRKT